MNSKSPAQIAEEILFEYCQQHPSSKSKEEKKILVKRGYGVSSIANDTNDWAVIRHNRVRDEGFDIGRYIQTPPIIFTRDAHNVWLGDLYRGCSAFLILGGPSFASINKEKLSQAGILTMSVNNSPKSFRPNLWACVDDPTHFIKSIWLDPKIMKFVPICHAEKFIFDNEEWKMTDIRVGDCPNVLFYRRNENFQANKFLWENTLNWGNHSKFGGGRSIFLPAIRLLFYLGVRKLYLLGCDLKMDPNTKYHFDQNRSPGSIKGNNETYEKLKVWFSELKPKFDSEGFQVFNCNSESSLRVFPFISFDDAVKEALSKLPKDLKTERTEGLYDRQANKKKKDKEAKL